MKHCTSICLILVGLIVVAGTASAGIGWPENLAVEASLSGGSTTNLYSDSSHQYCLFRATSLDLDYSVTAFAQVNLTGEYTYYRQTSNLSNLSYSAGATLIPLSDSSRFTLYLNGNMRDRQYRDVATDSGGVNANEFTGREYDAKVGLGFDLTSTAQLRTSLTFNSTGYDIEGVLDKETYDAAVGANVTLFNRFSLDLELGYSTGRYQYINPISSGYIPPPWDSTFFFPREDISGDSSYTILHEADLKSLYFSPRLSTSIGAKVGVSLTYMVRNFQDHDEDQTVYGYSTGWLSPWNTSYEGQATLLNLKTYLIPRLILSIDAGYWDKDYIKAVEYGPYMDGFFRKEGVTYKERVDRSDYRSRTAITLQMPLAHSSGYFLEPSVTFDYTDNKSTVSVYEYVDFSVSGGLTVRF